MQLKKAIESRKSVRRYSDKKPNWRKIIRAIDAVRFAPMAGNTNNIKFILISDEKVIRELKEASAQDFVGQAQYIVVAVSDDSQLKRLYDERAVNFARQQAGAAIQNFLLAITDLGMATCWVGYFDDRLVKRAVGIPEDFFVEAIFPIGFETKIKSNPKPKSELEGLVFFEKYGNKFMQGKIFVSNEAV
jgi:nitroreductase